MEELPPSAFFDFSLINEESKEVMLFADNEPELDDEDDDDDEGDEAAVTAKRDVEQPSIFLVDLLSKISKSCCTCSAEEFQSILKMKTFRNLDNRVKSLTEKGFWTVKISSSSRTLEWKKKKSNLKKKKKD